MKLLPQQKKKKKKKNELETSAINTDTHFYKFCLNILPPQTVIFFLIINMFTVVVWIKLKIQRAKDSNKASIFQGISTVNNSFKGKEDSFSGH